MTTLFCTRPLVRCWALLMTLLLLVGCAAPLIPAPREPELTRSEVSDALLIEQMRRNWDIMGSRRASDAERARALEDYNKKLLTLVQRLRLDARTAWEAKKQVMPEGFELRYGGRGLKRPLYVVYDDIVPASEIELDEITERVTVPGLGVPMVGVIPADKIERSEQEIHFRQRGTVSTLTAVMAFPAKRGARPVLHLIKRHQVEQMRVGSHRYEIAADFSAPIEIYWSLTRVKDDRWLGMLQPQELRDTTGLTCMENYNPNKIPVVLTHGLMSSASTFNNMVNRLMAYPEIRRNYQFWYFNYPTGVAWTLTADIYRKSLAEARRRLDPHKKNTNWDRMVVVGHSMGGLITRYSQCLEPWRMLEDNPAGENRMRNMRKYLDARYVHEAFPDSFIEPFRTDYFFEPVQAGMVVYLATPHRGSPVASMGIVSWLMRLIVLPQELISEVYNIATLQQDSLLMEPERMANWFTSGSQLSPRGYSIVGLQKLAVRPVPTHSVIGDRGKGDTPESSDGIVPYWSSHIGWGSETIVPSGHSVQDLPETAKAVAQMLLDYADKNKADRQRRPQRRAPSARRSASL